jgi:hypothetical protein
LAPTFLSFLKANFMAKNRKTSPDDPQHQGTRKANYKNVETSVNNPASFDDSYESKAEHEITREESRTEKEQRSGKKGRAINR